MARKSLYMELLQDVGLPGLEVDPAYMRRRLEASVGIGVSSFAGPFVVVSLATYFLLDWTLKASLIAGTALSTTTANAGVGVVLRIPRPNPRRH